MLSENPVIKWETVKLDFKGEISDNKNFNQWHSVVLMSIMLIVLGYITYTVVYNMLYEF